MNMLVFLLLLAILVWLWQESLRARETAILSCRKICSSMNAQLLDETVALASIKLQRNAGGELRLMRRYNFEISLDGVHRHHGNMLLLGNIVQHTEIQMPEGPVIIPDLRSITRH